MALAIWSLGTSRWKHCEFFDSWVGSFSTETNFEQKNVQGLVREEGTGLDAEFRDEKHKTWEGGRPELVSSW
jgi:hypothetical protein